MKIALTLVLAILLVAPALAQREAVVRGIYALTSPHDTKRLLEVGQSMSALPK